MKKRFALFICLLMTALFVFTGCGASKSTGKTETTAKSSSTTAATGKISPVGDWKYNGAEDTTVKELDVEFDQDGSFDFDIDVYNKEAKSEDIEAKLEGTYTYLDNSVTLTVQSVEDKTAYYNTSDVQNAQITLNYTLSNDGKSLTLTNAANNVKLLPSTIVLTKTK